MSATEPISEERRAEITRIQELIYELKIGQIMTRKLIAMSPEQTMAELKDVLRINRISGAPVVEGGKLAGVISIEDLIKALESGEKEARIRDKMATNVQTVYQDESVVSAVNRFAQFGYGRLPVLDRSGELVGIVTQGDVVRGLLKRMQIEYQEEEIHRYRASHIFEDIVSDQTGLILRYRVKAKDFVSGGEASSKLKRALGRLGAPPQVARRVAIATYEAEMNIIIHTDKGGEIIAEIMPERIRIVATDSGPGIPDVEQAMQPGYSTAPDWIRELGFGAGMGLSNIQACADKMTLNSTMGVGSRLEIVFQVK
ncbi:MAG: CBS domain-containing protein [Chloroflexi bacterium]|nr:CBS domain-containing protein [Chloroflexota bacterium]